MSVLDHCNGPFCPYCGCGQAEILQEPSAVRPRAVLRGEDPPATNAGLRWFGGGRQPRGSGGVEKPWYIGRARCGHCGRTFSFEAVVPQSISEAFEPASRSDPPDSDPQDLEPQLPDQRDAAAAPASAVPVCPDCGATMKVSSTRKVARYYKCPQCGKTKKTAR